MMTDQELQSLRNMGNECEDAANEIVTLTRDLAVAKALLNGAADRAEFSDKIIHGGDGSTSQCWELTIYLPVPVDSGVSARDALDTFLGAKP